ncbi:hypothetical protein N7G274_009157 [Stereocaulon virgatum]|uniref:Uncharacterized protein n=1 Tax=Stereocaulon virgatum TaxID=373712 RepID=A0ABR4A092_9LECA
MHTKLPLHQKSSDQQDCKMIGQSKDFTRTNQIKAPARSYPSIRHATPQPYSNPQNQPPGTRPKKSSSDTFIPIARSWSQPCAYPSAPTATERRHDCYTSESRWLFEPQRKQPWNAIGSVQARPFCPGFAEHVVKEKNGQTKDSKRATRGSASGTR